MAVTDERGFALRLRHAMPHGLGRAMTRSYNAAMNTIPFGLKYGIGSYLRRNRAPYRFLRPDDCVVQVGSARDILWSGRSRAVHLSRFLPQGQILVIEADPENQDALDRYIRKHSISNMTLVRSGAWNKKTTLEFWSNPSHPASNLVRESNDLAQQPINEADYERFDIPVDSIDNIVRHAGFPDPRMVCITTNGSELFILDGMSDMLTNGLEYVSLAPTAAGYVDEMKKRGYGYLANDDRGYFFQRGLKRPEESEGLYESRLVR